MKSGANAHHLVQWTSVALWETHRMTVTTDCCPLPARFPCKTRGQQTVRTFLPPECQLDGPETGGVLGELWNV